MKKLTKTLFLLTSLCSLQSCGIFSNKEVAAPPIPAFPTTTLRKGTAQINVDYAAQIESQKMIEIRSRSNGYIHKMYIKEGSKIKKGQKIAQIDPREYQARENMAHAAVKAAYANVSNAQLEVEKLTPLVDKNIVSKFNLTAAQSNYEAAMAALAQAQAQLKDAQLQLSYTTILSPVEGIISGINVYEGSLISSGSLLTTVAEKGDVFAYFAFDEKKVMEIMNNIPGKDLYEKIAQLPEVELILADGSIYPVKGKLEVASAIVNGTTGSVTLKGIFKNPDMVVRAGSTGKVRLLTHYNNVIMVPQKTTFDLQDKKLVYVYNASDSTLLSRSFVIEAQNSDYYFVKENELKEGDVVLFEGVEKVRDGMKIISAPRQ